MIAVAMTLRIWVMYRQSKIILGALLTLYAPENPLYLITCVIISTKFPDM